MSNRDIPYVKLLTGESSFQLVRTNPKLTGNVKIAIDENGGMWLESIKANPELSKDLYSKIPVDTNQSHPSNIFRFFNSGTTPNEIIFDIKEQVDSTKTSNDFKDQFDFSHYFSGAKYLASNKYAERMSYFAPLYLKKEIPNYFIIFKIEDPTNFPLDQVKQLYESGQNKSDYLIDLFKNASIIKTFDLGPESIPGKYIRDYVNDINFPISPLTVSYGEDDFTSWNGIIIKDGIFGSKGELLYDFYRSSQPLKFFEENITNGFSRNGILLPNILNLEFIFNDDTSDKYDFNRYLGLYVNKIELTKLDVDLDGAYINRATWENYPQLRKKFLDTDDVSFIQQNYGSVSSISISSPGSGYGLTIAPTTAVTGNGTGLTVKIIDDGSGGVSTAIIISPGIGYSVGDTVSIKSGDGTAQLTIDSVSNGVIIPFKNSTVNFSEFSNTFTDSESLFLNYITDKDNRLYIPKLSDPFRIKYEPAQLVSLSCTTTTVIASLASHGYITGDLIKIISSDLEYSGEFLITKIDDNTFSYVIASIPISSTANGSAKKELPASEIRFANNKIDLGLFFGQSRSTFLQEEGQTTKVAAKSHIVIKIESSFNNYDEIKIYHPNGTQTDTVGRYDLIYTATGYPLVPNPGDYYIYNDYDNILGYDQFYINGGGNLNLVAKALANAMNGIRSRTFTAYAYDTRIFIKLNSPGDFDTVHKVSFFSPTLDYSVISIDENTGNSIIGRIFNFKGGAPEIGNRLIIDSGHLTKITQNLDSILVKSSQFWSKIRKVSYFIDDINEANLNNERTKKDAVDNYYDKISIILDENETPSISNNEFLMKLKFKPSFGFLSFYLIKDLDFDFYNSTYTNFPNIDLYQYYFIPPGLKLLEPGVDYIVTGGSIILNEISGPVTITSGSNFTVSSIISYSIGSGSPFVTFYAGTNNKTIPILDENEELKDFPGFSILKDPSKVVPQNSSDEYVLKTKYLNGLTQTEYDFYKENESIDFALRSKIIPYITKWGISGGNDSRDNQYRLNTELIFGRNNFSPDHGDRTQNPANFTHEWFYIESKFNYANDESTLSQNTNYFDEPLSFTQLLSDPDYFINYFTYTPTTSSGKEVADTQLRYSTLSKNKAGEYETFFKGFKTTFRDVIDPNILGENGKPVFRENSDRFNGYKFSCILKPVEENINSKDVPPINYKVIEHKDFKFILIVIEISLGSLDNIDSLWKSNNVPILTPNSLNIDGAVSEASILSPGTGYSTSPNIVTTAITGTGTGLNLSITTDSLTGSVLSFTIVNAGSGYSVGDTVRIGPGPSSPSNAILTIDSVTGSLFETINGDYRIKFDPTGVSNLSHTLLYSLSNKKYSTIFNAFSNTKIASKLNLSTGVDPFAKTISQLLNPNFKNYPAELTDDIIKPNESTLLFIKDTSTNLDFFIGAIDQISFAPQLVNIIDYSLERFVHYDDSIYGLGIINPTNPISVFSVPPTSATSIILANYVFKVFTGGEKYHEKLFEKLSFANFKRFVNTYKSPAESVIEYYSYTYSESLGTSVLASNPNFYLEIPDVSSIEKSGQLITVFTNDIPVQFSGQNDIGYEYEVADLPVKYELNRYKGEYEPVIRNYSIYQSNYSFKNNLINDLSLSNVRLNSDVSTFLTIPTFNHIKVADGQILVLESDESYLPEYPKINEIAIGQADYFLLRGNWDWGFHFKYLDKSQYIPVSGARRVEEDDSFLSKLIVLPESIELENFKVKYVDVGDGEIITEADILIEEIIIKETPTAIEGVINVNNALTRYLIEDGIDAKFNEFIPSSQLSEYIGNYDSISNPDTKIASYVRDYIRKNILKLYDIDTNEFFSKVDNSLVSTNIEPDSNPNTIEFAFLNDAQRFQQGYSQIKSLQINKKDKLILKFRFTKKPGLGLSISPKIKIKFI